MVSVGELISKKQIKIELEMEMKKYNAPEMEVIELKYNQSLLAESDGTEPGFDPTIPPTDD